MRCLRPRTVGFKADGKTISWSAKHYSREFPIFQLPCGKCLQCRLEYARDAAVRCVHEAQMHDDNCFITLTYSDEYLRSSKLVYSDFQDFMKRLRSRVFDSYLSKTWPALTQEARREQWSMISLDSRKKVLDSLSIGFFATGEYGDRTKRPHWHALLFNYSPSDLVFRRSNDNGDRIYSSKILDEIWGKNNAVACPSEVGSVSYQSAGYCARYAAKKLVHGNDQDHDFHPIHKRSCRNAIGKKWLESYWQDCFGKDFCVIEGQKVPIPRYYRKWLAKHQPQAFLDFSARQLKQATVLEVEDILNRIDVMEHNVDRMNLGKGLMVSRNEQREKCLESNFNRLQAARQGE